VKNIKPLGSISNFHECVLPDLKENTWSCPILELLKSILINRVFGKKYIVKGDHAHNVLEEIS